MAAEGVSVELLEDAARDWGFRAGPLSIVDGMTAAAFARLVRDLAAAHGDRFAPRDDVERALREGGPRVRGAFTGLGRPMREEVQTRLALAFVNEAARALDDEIVESAAQADLASVLGVGFPLRRGGPMTYVRGLGPGEIVRRLEHCARRFGHRFAPAESLREERAR
jgi:3-hydroxyacyl-CoA dehydrogenase/enoyl-CoA hydratase/3-hydroxybutyryl-CoA epimerase